MDKKLTQASGGARGRAWHETCTSNDGTVAVGDEMGTQHTFHRFERVRTTTNRCRPKVNGFTLIELMIVVAIIGMLVAVAVPQYQQYTVRSKVVEGLSAADAAKTSLWDALAANQGVPIGAYVCCGPAGTTGYTFTPTDFVSRIDISAINPVPAPNTDGVITITFSTATVATPLPLVLNLVPGTGTLTPGTNLPAGAILAGMPIIWGCNTNGVSVNFPFVPANCRA